MKFHFAETYDDVKKIVFVEKMAKKAEKTAKKKTTKSKKTTKNQRLFCLKIEIELSQSRKYGYNL